MVVGQRFLVCLGVVVAAVLELLRARDVLVVRIQAVVHGGELGEDAIQLRGVGLSIDRTARQLRRTERRMQKERGLGT
jgi:hypothetical protein